MKWYPRYPGDYQRDTGHLSLCEHGAYAVLLDVFYSTERPIHMDRVHRAAGAIEKHERAAVDFVLEQFLASDAGRVGELESASRDQEVSLCQQLKTECGQQTACKRGCKTDANGVQNGCKR